ALKCMPRVSSLSFDLLIVLQPPSTSSKLIQPHRRRRFAIFVSSLCTARRLSQRRVGPMCSKGIAINPVDRSDVTWSSSVEA
ncbi:unnamed protein product, partial [Citrullus colocynthis]